MDRTPEQSRELAQFINYLQDEVEDFDLYKAYEKEVQFKKEADWSTGLKDLRNIYNLDV